MANAYENTSHHAFYEKLRISTQKPYVFISGISRKRQLERRRPFMPHVAQLREVAVAQLRTHNFAMPSFAIAQMQIARPRNRAIGNRATSQQFRNCAAARFANSQLRNLAIARARNRAPLQSRSCALSQFRNCAISKRGCAIRNCAMSQLRNCASSRIRNCAISQLREFAIARPRNRAIAQLRAVAISQLRSLAAQLCPASQGHPFRAHSGLGTIARGGLAQLSWRWSEFGQ